MKRLLFMIAAAFAVVFGSQAAFAQHNQAQTAPSGGKRIVAANQSDAPTTQHAKDYPPGPGQNPKEYSASMLVYLQPFMPKDTKVGIGWMVGKSCDQNGNFVSSGSAMCKIYVSHSAGKTYIFRPSEQEGDRVFVRNGSSAELYVQFNGGRYANTIAYQSPAAEKFASASGMQTAPVVASNGAAPAAAHSVDCKAGGKSLGDIIGCANGTVVAAANKPATPSPAADCSTGNLIARKICRAEAAMRGVTPTTATTLP